MENDEYLFPKLDETILETSKKPDERCRTVLRRIGSGTIDTALLSVAQLGVVALLYSFEVQGRFLIAVLVSYIVSILYNVYFIRTIGSTPGKLVYGLKLLTWPNGESRIPLLNSFLRESLNSVSVFSYLALIILFATEGLLADSDQIRIMKFHSSLYDMVRITGMFVTCSEIVSALFDKKRRALHDLIGSTVVVKEPLRNTFKVLLLTVLSFFVFALVSYLNASLFS